MASALCCTGSFAFAGGLVVELALYGRRGSLNSTDMSQVCLSGTGFGNIACNDYLPVLKANPKAALVFICAIDEVLCEQAVEQFGYLETARTGETVSVSPVLKEYGAQR